MKITRVTGGAGFLGWHLCDRLIAQGQDVLCGDNFFTGAKANIMHLLGHSRFELLPLDVTLPLDVEVDRIFNLACPASPVHYQRDPVETTKTSVHGAINMLGLAGRRGVRIVVSNFFVQALKGESIAIYGDGSQTRSFCHIDDLIEGMVRMMKTPPFRRPGEYRRSGWTTARRKRSPISARRSSFGRAGRGSCYQSGVRNRAQWICGS